MKKLTVFGSNHCPFTAPAKKYLDENGMDYDFINVTDSMANLKLFLGLRDTREEFAERKAAGKVGVPCIVVGDGEEFIFYTKDEDVADLKDRL